MNIWNKANLIERCILVWMAIFGLNGLARFIYDVDVAGFPWWVDLLTISFAITAPVVVAIAIGYLRRPRHSIKAASSRPARSMFGR